MALHAGRMLWDRATLRLPFVQGDAERLADYFLDVYAPSRSGRNNLRSFEGFVLDGPEYLTVFYGHTGEELETIPYKPGRHDDGLMWGIMLGTASSPVIAWTDFWQA